jgi:hypothetical protein
MRLPTPLPVLLADFRDNPARILRRGLLRAGWSKDARMGMDLHEHSAGTQAHPRMGRDPQEAPQFIHGLKNPDLKASPDRLSHLRPAGRILRGELGIVVEPLADCLAGDARAHRGACDGLPAEEGEQGVFLSWRVEPLPSGLHGGQGRRHPSGDVGFHCRSVAYFRTLLRPSPDLVGMVSA